MLALVAGVAAVIVSFALVPILSRIGKDSTVASESEEGAA
jgi:hypothetical protein